MNRFGLRALQPCLFLAAIAVAAPTTAGGTRVNGSIHHGHARQHHGVAIFRPQNRGWTNGVSISYRPPKAVHGTTKKSAKRRHAGKVRGDGGKRAKSRDKSRKRKHAKNDLDGRGKKKRSNRKHKRHKKNTVIYGTPVYVVLSENDYINPEDGDEDKCRHLIDRSYDRAGRRVLVEWTVCFDEQGEAYVPADGRRILARY